jgi:hypothetical protein
MLGRKKSCINNVMQIIGITCSTAAALFWSVAIILFKKSGDNFSPMALMGDVRAECAMPMQFLHECSPL